MFRLSWLVLVSAIFYQMPTSKSNECSGWTREEYLDFNKTVYVQWKVTAGNLTMKATGKTEGWLGIGFSSSGTMRAADIVMAWVKDGKGYLLDRHGLDSGNGRPPIDSKQNYQLLSSSENGSTTTFCFTRKLSTCDNDDYEITNDTVQMIWAMNDEDPANTNETSAKYHGSSKRGTSHQDLLHKISPKPTDKDIQSFDIKVTNVSVPAFETYYWCQFFRIPSLKEKHHLIGFEPLLQKENAHFVHHIEIYECTGDGINELIEKEMNNNLSKGITCNTKESPSSSFHCQKEIAFWAPGSQGNYYPEEAGYPIGNDQTKYYFGSFHYNNPKKKSDIVDSSGLRLLYTKHLRKYDAGLMLLGYSMHQPYLILPPGQQTWTSVAPCSSQCLQATSPPEGIHVYGILYHAHLTAKKLNLRHFRNGTELPPIGINNNYEFSYQQPQQFYDTILVLPNDTLITECIFNTTDRTKNTLGDIGTKDEMCMVYIYYYPRLSLDNCMSNLDENIIHKLVGVEELWQSSKKFFHDDLTIKEPETLRNVSLRKYLENYRFSPEQIKTLQENELKANKTPNCVVNGEMFQPKGLKAVNYPQKFKPYIKPNNCGTNK